MGKGITLRDGKDVTIVATGILVGEAIKAGELLAAEGIDARIINIHTIKPIDKELMIKASRETGRILTCEEHSIIGGLGSAVMEAIAEEAPCKVSRLGVNDQFGHSGPGAKLLEEFGFTAENIAARAKELLIIVGREDTIVSMTENAKKNRRYSGLKLRLQGKVQ